MSKTASEICDICDEPITNENESSELTLILKDRTKKIVHYHSDCDIGEKFSNWCDICGKYYDEDDDTVNAQYIELATNRFNQGQICVVCLSNVDFNKKFDVLRINFKDIEISTELMEKINKDLLKSPTYAMRFLALKGVIGLTLQFGEQFMREKYELARESLNQYGFDNSNIIAYEQLIEVVKQLTLTE